MAVSTEAGAVTAMVTVAPGEVAQVTLELGAWGSIEGIALAPDGTALAEVDLMIDSDSGQRKDGERKLDSLFGSKSALRTDDQGHFAVDGIGPGPARISFHRGNPLGSDHAQLGTHQITLQPGQSLDLGSFVVHAPKDDP